MRGVAVLVAVAGATRMPGERDLSSYTYEEYQQEFGKTTNDSERKAIFEDNLELIKQHNADLSKTWFATVNQFTDMTNEEFAAMTKGRKEKLFNGEPQPHVLTGRQIPDRKDWREENSVVTPVKNQGGCGSCWAFSAAETFESHLAIQTQTPVQKLSPQQIVSCSPNPHHCGGTGGCQGSTQPLAFDYTKTAGLTTEAKYPYKGQTGTCDTSKIAPVAYNGGYTILPTNDYNALMDAVANVGPVAISIAASGFKFQTYGGGVLSNCGDYVMDHAVQLVGYGTDSGKDYWLVRNSWGSWGEGGYIRFQRYGDGKEPCGTDNKPQDGDACEGDNTPRTYCGECGILSASSYPTDFTTTPPAPSPPTPPPPTPPSPGPTPTPPSPGPSGFCGGHNDQVSCEGDSQSGEPCRWCEKIQFCMTDSFFKVACNMDAVAV